MSTLPPDPPPRFRTLFGAVVAGAFLGAGLSLVRAVFLRKLEQTVGGAQRSFLDWRLAEGFREELPAVLLLGVLAGVWVWLWTRRFRGGRLLALAGASAALWLVVIGSPLTPEYYRLDFWITDDLAERILGFEAIGGGGALLVWLVDLEARRGMPRVLRWARAAGFAALLVLALPWTLGRWLESVPPVIQAREIRREVLVDPDSWDVRYHHPEAEPRVEDLGPGDLYTEEAGFRPTLVMAPPCELRFPITEEDGVVHLRVVAGIDRLEPQRMSEEDRPVTVVFEVEHDGRSVFRAEQALERSTSPAHLRWLHPDDPDELVLAPGDEITLRTSIAGLTREEAEAERPLKAGFAGLALVRVVERRRQRATPEAPSIVLILQDTLRSDHSSLYHYERETTPALAELASRGITYTRAYSAASWTWPSTASILTGLLPDAHGVVDDGACYLVGRNQTLAEVLQQRGFTTAAFACNPLITRQKNFDQGFEYFRQDDRRFVKTPELLGDVEDWIRMHAGLRFFLYLHLVDPHLPYAPLREDRDSFALPKPDGLDDPSVLLEYDRFLVAGKGVDATGKPWRRVFPEGHIEYLRSLYDASIATGDQCLRQLVGTLRELGLEDKTLVVFTSDHGESWLEHGLLTHGRSVHRQLMQVPLVLAGPGLPRGVVCDTVVSNRHLAATLARVGGGELTDVRDAIDLTTPEAVPARPVHYSTLHGSWNLRPDLQPIYGIRDGDWVLHFAPEGSDFGVPREQAPPGGQVRLYDVSVDPDEHEDVAAEHPEVAARLKGQILDSLAEQLRHLGASARIGADPETMRMLQAIGYTAGAEEKE